MSDLITSQMLSDWRANYGLDKRTPIKAMHWWQDNMDGKAPAGVVAALGLCINEIERLTAERDKARAERDALADVLPGYYYMDPPDGGNVPVLEQLRRMANDAARYRLLRRKFAIISDGEGHAEFCAINLPRPTYIAPNAAIELDTALDRERLGLDGTRPPTPVGWSDTDWIKRLQEQDEQPHPLAGQHINQGSMDAAADAYEAEYNAARGISEADQVRDKPRRSGRGRIARTAQPSLSLGFSVGFAAARCTGARWKSARRRSLKRNRTATTARLSSSASGCQAVPSAAGDWRRL